MLHGNYVLGYQHDTVSLKGSPYLKRWFVYIFGFTLRLHKFYRGDDDRAPHDHPWPFWTFPLTGYWERVWDSRNQVELRYVKPWRLHGRPTSGFRHMVLGSRRHRWLDQWQREVDVLFDTPVPFWTIVFTKPKDRSWGFYPNGEYVYYRDFK